MYKMKKRKKRGWQIMHSFFGNLSKNTMVADSHGNFDCVCNTCWNKNQTIH